MIDVLFAVFVVSIALVGIIAAFGPVIKSNNYARKEIVATQLAQEGVELMRAKRDMKLRDQSTAGVFTCTTATCSYVTGGPFNVSYNLAGSGGASTETSISRCDDGYGSGNLWVNNEGLFNCENTTAGGNKESEYRRVISVNASNVVTSTVTWGNPVKTISITNTLSSWGQP